MKTAEDAKDAKRFLLPSLEEQPQTPGKRNYPAEDDEQEQRYP